MIHAFFTFSMYISFNFCTNVKIVHFKVFILRILVLKFKYNIQIAFVIIDEKW